MWSFNEQPKNGATIHHKSGGLKMHSDNDRLQCTWTCQVEKGCKPQIHKLKTQCNIQFQHNFAPIIILSLPMTTFLLHKYSHRVTLIPRKTTKTTHSALISLNHSYYALPRAGLTAYTLPRHNPGNSDQYHHSPIRFTTSDEFIADTHSLLACTNHPLSLRATAWGFPQYWDC